MNLSRLENVDEEYDARSRTCSGSSRSCTSQLCANKMNETFLLHLFFFPGNDRSNSLAFINRPHGHSKKKATKGKTNTRFGSEFGKEEKRLSPTEQLTLQVRLSIELLHYCCSICYTVTIEMDFGSSQRNEGSGEKRD